MARKVDKKIRILMDAVTKLPGDQGEMLIDRLLDRLLESESTHPTKAKVVTTGAHLRSKAGESFVDKKIRELTEMGAIEKEEKRQKHLVEKKVIEKKIYSSGLECMNITDEAGTDGAKLKSLLRIANLAAKDSESKPIPETTSFDSFDLVRHNGPAPAKVNLSYKNESITLSPPISVRKLTSKCYSYWIEWEKVLNDIKSYEVKVSDKDFAAMQQKLIFDERISASQMRWHELVPKNTGDGIPDINAETAREILRRHTSGNRYDSEFFDLAPASWLSVNGRFSSEFSDFLKEGMLGRTPLNRVMKLALSRMLMTPIGEIEKKLFSVAFLEVCDANPQKKEENTHRGRGRPRKFLTDDLLQAGLSDAEGIAKSALTETKKSARTKKAKTGKQKNTAMDFKYKKGA